MKQEKKIWLCPLILLGFILILSTGCKKDDNNTDDSEPTATVPVITSSPISNITQTTATSGGNITSDGNASVTSRGVCWNTATNPTTSNSKTTDGSGTGAFTSSVTGLTLNTTYYIRAYATNTAGTAYGNEISFTTSPTATIPVITTASMSNISQTTATCGGNVTSDGYASVTSRGVCWNTATNPTISNSKTTDGSGTGAFTSSVTGLTLNTTYYIRAYATNTAGTAYGNEISFTTSSTATIAIGQSYEGGIIFYIDGTGLHGLIAAPSDQGIVNWGCEGTSVIGTSTALGKGQANTTLIVNKCNTNGIAARICNDLVLNGKSDWYLPSKDELNLMHENLYLQGLGNFIMNRYWSSSQYNAQFAWCQFFNLNLNQLYYDKDLIAYSVRAIRSF